MLFNTKYTFLNFKGIQGNHPKKGKFNCFIKADFVLSAGIKAECMTDVSLMPMVGYLGVQPGLLHITFNNKKRITYYILFFPDYKGLSINDVVVLRGRGKIFCDDRS